MRKVQVQLTAKENVTRSVNLILEVPDDITDRDLRNQDGGYLERIANACSVEWDVDESNWQGVEPDDIYVEAASEQDQPHARLVREDNGEIVWMQPESAQELAKDEAVQIHWVVDGKGWIHTHGMSEHGLPELEIRDCPNFLGEAASSLLRQVCDYMRQSGKSVRAGETMATSFRTRFRFVRPVPIPGEEDHYETERWQIVDVECPCDNCGVKLSERN